MTQLFRGQSIFDQIVLKASAGITVANTNYKISGGVLPMALVGLTNVAAPTAVAGASYTSNEQNLINAIVTTLKSSGLMH